MSTKKPHGSDFPSNCRPLMEEDDGSTVYFLVGLLSERDRVEAKNEGIFMRFSSIIGLALIVLGGQAAFAETSNPNIADVEVKRDSPDQSGIYHVKVVIEHEDTGWDDYVDAWEIIGSNGMILGVRPFFEPELDQSRTVSALAGVVIPEDVKTVTIRTRKHPDGYKGDPVEITIPH